MRGRMTRVLYAAAAATTLIPLGLAGSAGTAAARVLSRPVPTDSNAGYQSQGRWFRLVSTTVTIPPVIPSARYASNMIMALGNTAPLSRGAVIFVAQGGGPRSVGFDAGQGVLTWFAVSPKIGDRLRVSIYYDRRGHTSFTAADLTQKITRVIRVRTGNVIYNVASVEGNSAGGAAGPPPGADRRLWKLDNTRLTTYSGTRGTMTGPWQTIRIFQTSTGTSAGTVIRSPSRLSDGGASFGIWLRALPWDYTSGFAGYGASGGHFRLAATTLTVPARPADAGNASLAYIGLSHAGGPTPRPYGYIRVRPGGGPGSVSYDCLFLPAIKALAISPRPGDQLSVSVFYDQHGHLRFTAVDVTLGTRATATEPARLASTLPYNTAGLQVYIDNGKVSRPPADIRLWAFTASMITTYTGVHGSILGPWRTTEEVDTTTGTASGAVVMSPSLLSNTGRTFSVWLRHQ